MDHPGTHPFPRLDGGPKGPEASLRLVAWEVTRACNLECVHCRAGSGAGSDPGALNTARCMEILDEIRSVGTPIVILTGGEPLLRPDVFDLARAGSDKGLRMVMATNGTLLTPQIVDSIRSSGIQRVSVSIDGADAQQHDAFRQVPGAFQRALDGIALLKQGGVDFQINTTVTRQNVADAERILRLAEGLGASAHHLFLLVPTGRARSMQEQEIDAAAYERLLHWFHGMHHQTAMSLKATCAPHYYRVLRQEARRKGEEVTFQTHGLDAVTRGCLGGTAFCFISSEGLVQPCGYLELTCGDLKQSSFPEVWAKSEIFQRLRDFSAYKGKCGRCGYLPFCGGCRARAFEATGDYLAEEPLCAYQPGREERP